MTYLRLWIRAFVETAQGTSEAVVFGPQRQVVKQPNQQRLPDQQLSPLASRGVVEHPWAGECDRPLADQLPCGLAEVVVLCGGERGAVPGEGNGLLVAGVGVHDGLESRSGLHGLCAVAFKPGATSYRGQTRHALPGDASRSASTRCSPSRSSSASMKYGSRSRKAG